MVMKDLNRLLVGWARVFKASIFSMTAASYFHVATAFLAAASFMTYLLIPRITTCFVSLCRDGPATSLGFPSSEFTLAIL